MLTLVEAAKLAANNGQTVRAAVIAMFARSSSWLAFLPFMDIQGNAYGYNREGELPGVAFRGVNESFDSSTGIVNPMTEALRISGGDLDVDTFIIRTMGAGIRATHENMKVKALSAAITRTLIKGDSATNPREFDGLQNRITGSQLIENHASTGGPLSLEKLDEVIDAVPGAAAIWLNKALRRRIKAAARNVDVGGHIEYRPDEFGRDIMFYNGLPLLVPYEDNDGVEPVAFDEAAASGGSDNTSLYVVSTGPGRLAGIQSRPMEVRDLGELDETPAVRTRVEWDIGMVVEHGRAAARLRGITNAAVVK